jgi:hypothetical protein
MQAEATPDTATVLPEPSQWWVRREPWLKVHGSLMTLLCGLALLCFALPWVVVSCGTARTEQLSGFELAFGMDPGINDFADPDDVREVEKMVSGLQDFAVLMFLVAAGALVCGVLMALVPAQATGRIGLFLATMAAQGYFGFWAATEEYWGADAERQNGLYFAQAFALLAAIWAIPLAALTRGGNRLSHSRAAWSALVAVCLVVPLTVLSAAGGEGAVKVAVIAGVLVCVVVWCVSALLTISEPTWKSGVALLLSGIPLALLTGGV